VQENHPLREPSLVRAIERAASAHLGRPWSVRGFTDLNERASHPCGILHGRPFSVFAKVGAPPDADRQFTAELAGLRLLRREAGVATPVPVADGVVAAGAGALLLLEALPETPAGSRSAEQWRSIGRALAAVHRVRGERFGLDAFDGFFGPLPQDNRPVRSNRWADFYARRRLAPGLRSAVDSGWLSPELAAGVERLAGRLGDLCGPEPRPSLLHGDAQQNNFLTTATGAVLLDAAPYFGHPELDLALVDYITPVPDEVFHGYREVAPVDPGFPDRRELWRIAGYLAAITVEGHSSFGRQFLGRIADAIALYR
jgi:fructosamine-3-kinase